MSFSEIQFQDRVDQQIEMILMILLKANAFIDMCAAANDSDSNVTQISTVDEMIDSLKDSYVMESQRKHHATVLNQKYEEKLEESVELF